MKPNNTKLELDSFLPYRLSVTSNRISRWIASMYSDQFGLTIPQWRVIAILGEHSSQSAKQLVLRTAMDKVAVSRAVRQLIDREFVDREVVPMDGRSTLLSLSKNGEIVYERIAPVALKIEKRLLNSLSDEEITSLNSILDKLTSELDAVEQNP